MEVEEKKQENQPKDSLDNKKSPGNKVLKILGLIPRIFNPFGGAYSIRHNRLRDLSDLNNEILISMSDIVSAMPFEFNRLLTIIDPKRGAITPQQSFIEYFEDYDLLHINPLIFKYRFMDLFQQNREQGARKLRRGPRTQQKVEAFGNNFLPLLDKDRKNTREDYLKPSMKLSIRLVIFSQKIRRYKRVLMSGISSN